MDTSKTLSLTELVEQYTQDLYSWALHKVSDTELAKDLVQDTFLAAAEKIETFKGESTHKTWLFSILNHKIIDVYRKKVKQPITTENDVFSKFFDAGGDFPAESVKKEFFQETKFHTICPWKGTASYYTIEIGGQANKNAAWYYPESSELAKNIKGRVAFWKGVEFIQE